MVVDLSQPLISGCFLPLEDDRVSWVYFRYEGIYKFCKECGCVCHNTSRCNLSAYDAHRMIQRRVRDLEDKGMLIIRTNEGIPFYTNMIQGLHDRFINRNPRVNLNQIIRPLYGPQQDPYMHPHIPDLNYEMPDSSDEDFFESSPEMPHHPFQGYSDQNSQHHTNLPMDFSNSSIRNLTPSRLRERLCRSPTPDSRFGPDPPARGSVAPPTEQVTNLDCQLNLNPPPQQSSSQSNPPSGHAGQNRGSLFDILRLSN